MDRTDRRGFLGAAGWGMAGLGLSQVLPANLARATEGVELSDGKDRSLVDRLLAEGPVGAQLVPTEKNALGPFYMEGAPYRAKLTPPLEPGVPVLIRGRIWSLGSGAALPLATLDVWQANASGEYDNRKTTGVTTPEDFHYRARLLSDEKGYYEFETIHPGGYRMGGSNWRPSHIHYLVQAPGHETLVTQLYFKGDPRNETDSLFRESLAIAIEEVRVGEARYERGIFDVVLTPKAA